MNFIICYFPILLHISISLYLYIILLCSLTGIALNLPPKLLLTRTKVPYTQTGKTYTHLTTLSSLILLLNSPSWSQNTHNPKRRIIDLFKVILELGNRALALAWFTALFDTLTIETIGMIYLAAASATDAESSEMRNL